MKKRWTETELNSAILMHSEGLLFNEIAVNLNKTTKAVKVKLNNLGYKQNNKDLWEEIICLECGTKFISLKKKIIVNFVHIVVQPSLIMKNEREKLK